MMFLLGVVFAIALIAFVIFYLPRILCSLGYHLWTETAHQHGQFTVDGYTCDACGEWGDQEAFEAFRYDPFLFRQDKAASIAKYRSYLAGEI